LIPKIQRDREQSVADTRPGNVDCASLLRAGGQRIKKRKPYIVNSAGWVCAVVQSALISERGALGEGVFQPNE